MSSTKSFMSYEKALKALPYVCKAGGLILKMLIYGAMVAGIAYMIKSSRQTAREMRLDQLFQSKYPNQRIKKQVCQYQWNMIGKESQGCIRIG